MELLRVNKELRNMAKLKGAHAFYVNVTKMQRTWNAYLKAFF
jgi:hypothetical protein